MIFGHMDSWGTNVTSPNTLMCLPILSFDETARLRYSSYIF
jgi:hypothetical protein